MYLFLFNFLTCVIIMNRYHVFFPYNYCLFYMVATPILDTVYILSNLGCILSLQEYEENAREDESVE